MFADPQVIALELWELLEGTGNRTLSERDTALVGHLRDSLELPSQPRNPTSLVIPTKRAGVALLLRSSDGHYTVSQASPAELPGSASSIAITTRKGVLVVDPDDPLARARRSIENLDALKF